jgi:Spy/CpxP family protein refolding chaperone
MPALRFLVPVLLLLALPAVSSAQGVVGVVDEHPVLTPHEASAFNRVFSTTPDQQRALQSLLGAAMTQVRDAQSKTAALWEAFRALPEDRRTRAARDELRAKTDALTPDTDALRKTLLADLRALLTAEQDSRWKKFEYFIRRERVLAAHDSGLMRDKTNLLALIDAVPPGPEPGSDLAAFLERYERDLDTILAEIEAAEADFYRKLDQLRTDGDDPAARQAAVKPYTTAANRLAQFNFQSARRAAALLPPDQATRLRKLYDMVSLSEALGPNQPDLAIRSAPALPGLTDDNRDKVRRIVAEYAPHYDALSLRIAAMERGLRQRDPTEEVLDRTDWDPVRMERGRLMSETHKKVQALLTPEQFHAMLEEGGRQERAWRVKMSR